MKFELQLLKLLNLEPNHTVLDLGCGAGRFIPLITERINPSGKVHGLDIDRSSIEKAKKSNQSAEANLECFDFDSNLLPFEENSFDRIICHNVLECIENKIDLLNECYR